MDNHTENSFPESYTQYCLLPHPIGGNVKIINTISVLFLLILCGCSHIGPQTVARDRFDYNSAIADSWKEQTLLNIVKLRYLDMPLFVEVASVVSGYTLEGSVDLGGTVSSEKAVQGDFVSLGTSGKYTDRPTITYAPITGEKFNKSFMTPIPPKALLFLMQSGWPVELIFPIVVEAINGLRNQKAIGQRGYKGDVDFYRFIRQMQKIQDSGNVSMRVVKDEKDKETTLVFFYRQNLPIEIDQALDELENILHLKPNSREFKISYGLIPETNQEIALQTRSMLQIMVALAKQIDVPATHVAEGRTFSSPEFIKSVENNEGRLIKVHTSSAKPDNSFVSVPYKDYWFWIDDRDLGSKRTFTFIMVLFSLTESGGKGGLPLVTIPAG